MEYSPKERRILGYPKRIWRGGTDRGCTEATLLPNYVIYDRLGITDTIWALLIPYVAFSLPQGFFLTSSFMDAIPRELEEAALIIYILLNKHITKDVAMGAVKGGAFGVAFPWEYGNEGKKRRFLQYQTEICNTAMP